MSENRQRDAMISVRVTADEARELRQWSERTGRPVASILREGMHYPLERQRALWLEEHRDDPDAWEVVPGSGRLGEPRRLDAVFGVRLTGEQMRDMLPAAELAGMPLSAFMRDAGLRLAAAMAAGGTASCGHFSIGGTVSAECAGCGPLPVTYLIGRRAS
jgi:hypothetical protein